MSEARAGAVEWQEAAEGAGGLRMDKRQEPRETISAREAAELLGVSRATVISWAKSGRFGGYQFGTGGIYRFDRQELLDYIGRSRIQPHGAGLAPGEQAQG
jgi:excisionase family DNA binding protein